MKRTANLAGAAVAAVAFGWLTPAWAELTGVYDLAWNGSETSMVTESPSEIFSISYPVRGGLQLDLDTKAPRLINVMSDILLYPGGTPNTPPAISPNLWHNLDLLSGEYLEPLNEGDISLRFTPTAPDGLIRGGWELLVDITNGGQSLSLTGGIQQDAASPMEPDVVFAVSGRLPAIDNLGVSERRNDFVPEPASGLLLISCTAGLGVIASRRRQ